MTVIPFSKNPFRSKPRYKLIDSINRGGYGVVDLVTENASGKTYARKTVTLLDKDIAKKVHSEYKFLVDLDHPHIVKYVDFELARDELGYDVARLYMEFCEHGDLHKHMLSLKRQLDQSRRNVLSRDSTSSFSKSSKSRQKPKINAATEDGAELPEWLVWQILVQLSSALAYCHFNIPHCDLNEIHQGMSKPGRGQICHRDLTPNNIFLARDPKGPGFIAKVGDFGLAVDLKQRAAKTWTGPGEFTAPEITKGNEKVLWTLECDIYSLGCITYFMCTGSAPDQLFQQSQREIAGAIPDIYSDELSRLIFRCSRENPSERSNACLVYNEAKQGYMRAIRDGDSTSAPSYDLATRFLHPITSTESHDLSASSPEWLGEIFGTQTPDDHSSKYVVHLSEDHGLQRNIDPRNWK